MAAPIEHFCKENNINPDYGEYELIKKIFNKEEEINHEYSINTIEDEDRFCILLDACLESRNLILFDKLSTKLSKESLRDFLLNIYIDNIELFDIIYNRLEDNDYFARTMSRACWECNFPLIEQLLSKNIKIRGPIDPNELFSMCMAQAEETDETKKSYIEDIIDRVMTVFY